MAPLVPLIRDFAHFVYENRLSSAWLLALAIAALPKPGATWTYYEIIHFFLNGVAANLPQRKNMISERVDAK